MPISWSTTIKGTMLAMFFGMLLIFAGCTKQSSSISGTVTYGGTALAGVTVSAPGLGSKVTDANGNYSFSDVGDGSYIITATLAGYTFVPATRTAFITEVDAKGFDFSAVCPNRVATSQHTLYVKADGTVLAWGNNANGQLGNNSTVNSATPVQVTGLTNVTAVAAGSDFSLALKSDGTVMAWGHNNYGQLGIANNTDQLTPVQVSALDPAGGVKVVYISAGGGHAAAVKSDGTMWLWGHNADGQLGVGTYVDSNIPLQIASITGVTSVSAGYDHTLALRSDGSILAWGNNSNGQLGTGTTTAYNTPITIVGSAGIQVAAGTKFSAVLIFSSTVYNGTISTWGMNTEGQLGIGTSTDSYTPIAVNLKNVIYVSAGTNHVTAVSSDGTVTAWGGNASGQLGNGTETISYSPIQSVGDTAALANICLISSGNKDTIAYKNDGSVWVWGDNTYGQLGDGTTVKKSKAVTFTLP